MTLYGLNDRTRTYDLYHPKVAFYQTELHPDIIYMVGQAGLEPAMLKATGLQPAALPIPLTDPYGIIKTPYIDKFGSLVHLQIFECGE